MSRKFQCKAISSTWLENNGRRLDCGPYMSGAIEARMLIKKIGFEPLSDLTHGFSGGIFKAPRLSPNYVSDPDHGSPYLSSTDILCSDLSLVPLIANSQAKGLRNYFVEKGMTLVTSSGDTGRAAFARDDMHGMMGSPHFMRIKPDESKIAPGYLFAFLSSKYGNRLMVSGTYGSIIQAIEPHHIADLPVPRLGTLESQVHDLVGKAGKLRTEASKLLRDTSDSIRDELGAPEVKSNYSIAQIVKSSELLKTMRMEGYFYNQKAREVDSWATKHSNGIWLLGDTADIYDVPLFKHIYVDSDYGVPFYTSGELFKLERKAEKYLSHTQTKDLKKYILGRNWVLLARSGQLGGIICRPQFSDSALEGTATSDHIIRIVPRSNEVPPGYIYAYLATPEIGYPLIARTASGTSIPALWPVYLKSLPVVKADPDFMKAIDVDVKNAFEMRVQATCLEDEARSLVERAIEVGGH